MHSKATHVLAAVVHRNGRLLLCQRPSHKRHGDLWEFPGGKLLDGETHEDAAHRELREELDVEVVNVGAIRFSSPDPGSEFVIDFVEVEIHGEPKALEHQAIAWVPLDKIANYRMPPTDRAFANAVRTGETEDNHGQA